MADVTVRELQPGDVAEVLADLRPADRAEITALVGADGVAAAVEQSARNSVQAWALVQGAAVLAVFGVAPCDGLHGVGSPWMVGTPGVTRVRRAFMRLCRVYVPRMLALFPNLWNVVDARNTISIAWLKSVGFIVGKAEPTGIEGRPFHVFYMEA